jgi:hypothetical protein
LTGRAAVAGVGRAADGRPVFVGGLLVAGLLDALADDFPDAAEPVRGLADLPPVLDLLGGLRCAIACCPSWVWSVPHRLTAKRA